MAALDAHNSCGHLDKKAVFRIVVCGLSAFMLESSTTLVAIIGLFIAMIIDLGMHNKERLKNLLGGKKLFLAVLSIFVIILFMSSDGNWFVTMSVALGKDITYNGRTALWSESISLIRKNPLFGVGPSLVLDVGWNSVMTHAHCLYLNICAKHGVIALAILVIIIWKSFTRNKSVPWFTYVCFALYLVGSIVEVYPTFTLFFFCTVLYHSSSGRKSSGWIHRRSIVLK